MALQKKRKKSCFLDFEKKRKKNVFSNYGVTKDQDGWSEDGNSLPEPVNF